MMETDPDWAPSLHLGHTETTLTNPARSERQRAREQRQHTEPTEGDGEQNTEVETQEAEGGSEQNTEEESLEAEGGGEQNTEEETNRM